MDIPTGYAQVNYIFGGSAAPLGAQVTLGLDISAFSGDAEDVATAATAAWSASGIPTCQVASIELRSVLVKFGPNSTGPSFNRPTAVPGTIGNDGVAPNTAILVKKQTAFGGRAGRGRMYIPGAREDEIGVTGGILSGYLTDWQVAMDAFGVELSTALLTPVVLHGEGSPLSTPSEITSFSVDGMAATQRRRMRR